MVNVEQTIISQYGNSATITRLVQNMNKYLDPRANFDDFFNFIWNVDTAQGFGLDIWGRIVGVSRQLFAGTQYQNDDEPYRQLILVKALANISAATAPAINQLLRNWLGSRGRVYMNDLGNMQIRYTFEFLLQPFELLIVESSGIFLRPAGVSATLLHGTLPMFGFREGGTRAYTGFNQAPFISEDAVHGIS